MATFDVKVVDKKNKKILVFRTDKRVVMNMPYQSNVLANIVIACDNGTEYKYQHENDYIQVCNNKVTFYQEIGFSAVTETLPINLCIDVFREAAKPTLDQLVGKLERAFEELMKENEALKKENEALMKENEALITELKLHPDGKYILETLKTRFETGDYSNIEKVLSE